MIYTFKGRVYIFIANFEEETNEWPSSSFGKNALLPTVCMTRYAANKISLFSNLFQEKSLSADLVYFAKMEPKNIAIISIFPQN